MTDATILLADDDKPTRLTSRCWLTHLQVRGQVLEAADGQEALALVAAHCHVSTPPRPLLVLVLPDLKMLILDSLAFLERQR